MKFADPIWLIVALAAGVCVWWGFRIFQRTRTETLKRFAAERLLPGLTAGVSDRARAIKRWLFILAVVLALVALARPQYGFHWQEVKRKGIDILFAVDTSKSMLAQDVNPDRLTRAKLAVTDFVEKLEGDRVGLIAFSGTSFLQCPLTLDYDAFRQSLEAVGPSIIPKGGTDLAAAFREAEEAFSMGEQNHKILVVLTDGEDLEAQGLEAAKQAAKNGMKIFTIGVGSPAGELIPIRNEAGGVEFLKDGQGKPVRSKLDEATLRQVAETSGGLYAPLGQRGEGLETIYNDGLSEIPKQELSARMNRIHIDRYQWPLGLAILLLIIELMLGERKNKGLGSRVSGLGLAHHRRTKPEAVAALILLTFATAAWASPQSAEEAYRAGQFEQAATEYKAAADESPKKAELQFNQGASTYKTGQYESAAEAFQRALKTEKVDLQQPTFYNLGNTQYRIGQKTEKSDPKQTIQTWEQALQSYEHAMSLNPEDADAKFNYEFVKKKLEELKKQQEQQQDQKQDQKQDQQQQDQKDQKDGKGQQNQKDKQDGKDEQKDQQDKKDGKNQPDQQDKKDGKDAQDQQNKKDGKNPQDQQDQKDGQDKKDPQKPENQPGGEKPEPAEQKPDQKQKQAAGGNGSTPLTTGQKSEMSNEESAPKALPGQMTKEEAKNLLDSLKGDERKMPAAIRQGGSQEAWDETPEKDW